MLLYGSFMIGHEMSSAYEQKERFDSHTALIIPDFSLENEARQHRQPPHPLALRYMLQAWSSHNVSSLVMKNTNLAVPLLDYSQTLASLSLAEKRTGKKPEIIVPIGRGSYAGMVYREGLSVSGGAYLTLVDHWWTEHCRSMYPGNRALFTRDPQLGETKSTSEEILTDFVNGAALECEATQTYRGGQTFEFKFNNPFRKDLEQFCDDNPSSGVSVQVIENLSRRDPRMQLVTAQLNRASQNVLMKKPKGIIINANGFPLRHLTNEYSFWAEEFDMAPLKERLREQDVNKFVDLYDIQPHSTIQEAMQAISQYRPPGKFLAAVAATFAAWGVTELIMDRKRKP